jgi:hypothetical protein
VEQIAELRAGMMCWSSPLEEDETLSPVLIFESVDHTAAMGYVISHAETPSLRRGELATRRAKSFFSELKLCGIDHRGSHDGDYADMWIELLGNGTICSYGEDRMFYFAR